MATAAALGALTGATAMDAAMGLDFFELPATTVGASLAGAALAITQLRLAPRHDSVPPAPARSS